MIFGLLLEGLVALLLVVTVVYCVLLDRRLRALRDGQDGLKSIIEGLDAATSRAQMSISELKTSGDRLTNDLSGRVAKARALTDELSIMIDAGNSLADRLDAGRGKAGATSETERAERRGPKESGLGPRPVDEIRHAEGEQQSGRDAETHAGEPPDGHQSTNRWEEALLKALRQAR